MVEEKGRFMKGSWFNKFFFCIPIMTVFMPACGGEMTKYEWMASESAPRGYPMQVLVFLNCIDIVSQCEKLIYQWNIYKYCSTDIIT
jgi:hypothetical protein